MYNNLNRNRTTKLNHIRQQKFSRRKFLNAKSETYNTDFGNHVPCNPYIVEASNYNCFTVQTILLINCRQLEKRTIFNTVQTEFKGFNWLDM